MNFREATVDILDQAISFVAKSPWKDRYLVQLERIKEQVNEPCVLAVAGRVKAGKSTLVNALLGQDLALVGATETTATINYFRYGVPPDSEKPVRCVWMNERSTWESTAFVDSLQGTSEDSLKRASAIRYLEFNLPHPDLREVTLVDTPGTDAIAGEDGQSHEAVTGAFFGVNTEGESSGEDKKRLSERHAAETRQLSSAADAVIYLVGQVAHASNEDFLTEFHRASSGTTHALNAVGVMSKIDETDDVLNARHDLAKSIADKLKKELNTVVPVSAALWKSVCELKKKPERMGRIKEALAGIPKARLDRMLKNDAAFLREYDDCPVSVHDRKEIMAGMPWRVFVLIARAIYEHDPDVAVRELEELSGFAPLRRLIDDHFFKRSRLLRCYRILSDLHKVLEEIKRNRLAEYKKSIKTAKAELLEFTDFIITHPQGKSETAHRLRRYLERHVPDDEGETLKADRDQLADALEAVRDELEVVNRQFMGLQLLDQADADQFTNEELGELRELFGLYAGDAGQRSDTDLRSIGPRQIHWRQVQLQSKHPLHKQVAKLAVMFYGMRIQAIQQGGGT